MEPSPLESYFREQQVSLQWLPFLRAMATELAQRNDAASLRVLFASIGKQCAQDANEAFSEISTLPELSDALNDYFVRINWGFVDISETQGNIEINHYAAPLAEAFGDENLQWSVGFLEGFYQSLFETLGASNRMQVRAVDHAGQTMHLRFLFGR